MRTESEATGAPARIRPEGAVSEQQRRSEEPEVLNPRFAGATFGDVARGLFRPAKERDAQEGEEDETGGPSD